jgi:BlaI family penicillinase repressor
VDVADYRLTELQLEIMAVLWDRGEATVEEVREALAPDRELAHTTVSTLLSRLAKRELVTRRKEGRSYVYQPMVEPERVQRSVVNEIGEVADRLFAGDVADLVATLISESDVDADDLARVREMIAKKEAELRGES